MNLKNKAIDGVKWTSLSNGIRAIFQILQLMVLARYLTSEDFGLVAIVMVVIGFSQLFMDMGVSNAIIHKQAITESQLDSLYWLNVFSGTFLTLIVYLTSPFIAQFYNAIKIIPLLQILSFSFVISSFGNQYRVLLRKDLKFDVLAKIDITATFISFLCAIILAIGNFGAFSLVYAFLLNTAVSNIILLIMGFKFHRPKFIFKYVEVKSFLTFGLYQIGQNSIIYLNSQVDIILIGKLLGPEVLGLYSLTKQLVMRPAQLINPIITNVTFPVMSKVQDDTVKLKSIYLKIINYISSMNFPLYMLIIILAEPIVLLVLGKKWGDAIIIFQILGTYAMLRSTTSPAGSLLLSKGRADIGFWWSLSELFILLIIIYYSSSYGIIGITIGILIFQILYLLPNWYFIINKMCKASFSEYFIAQFKPFLVTITSVILTYIIINNFQFTYLNKIIIFTIINFVIYLIISNWINKEFLKEIKNLIQKRFAE